MDDVTIASSEADARAADAVERHHAELSGALALRAGSLAALARDGRTEDLAAVRDELLAWARLELLPHASAEEDTIYRAAAARPEGRLLVEAMLAEHKILGGLVDDLAQATTVTAAAVAAGALRAVFEAHLAKENEQLLPMLVADPGVSVVGLLDGMHELLGAEDATGQPSGCGGAGHSCTCGETDGPEYPELDARTIPHAIRHATIFGALDGVRAGSGMVLVAPHDPLPLLAQLEQRAPGAFDVDYLQRGPEAWRLSLVRR